MTTQALEQLPHASGWDEYWETLTGRQRLFREQAAQYVRNLCATGLLGSDLHVLDFGCGFGFVAEGVAPRVGALYLWDASPNMRARAAVIAAHGNVHAIMLGNASADPARQFDLILVNSVVQYMAREEFAAWLGRWRAMLRPSGRILVSDVIPPERRTGAEIIDLLRFSARGGFLFTAMKQAIGEIGRYRQVRQAAPLTRIGRGELVALARSAGLDVAFLPKNLTHFRGRITAVFTAT